MRSVIRGRTESPQQDLSNEVSHKKMFEKMTILTRSFLFKCAPITKQLPRLTDVFS